MAVKGKEKQRTAAEPSEQVKVSSIAQKAMLAKLTIHFWNAHGADQRVNEEVVKNHKSVRGMGSYRKKLIPSDALSDLVALRTELRNAHSFTTLPWKDGGFRCLPSAAYFSYKTRMTELEAKFNKAVKAFCDDYPAHLKNAKLRLGGLFNDEDYPTAAEVRRRYRVELNIIPIPSGKDFRCDVGDDEVKKIREAIEEDSARTLQEAMSEPWQRLKECIGHMAERLKGFKETKEGKRENSFRDSLVTNIVELLDVIPVLNVTGDKELTEFAKTVRAELTQHTAEVLRDDGKIRKDVAAKAADILKKMEAFL